MQVKRFATLFLLAAFAALAADSARPEETKPVVIGTWKGSGIKQTESFSTPRRECQILWKLKATSGTGIFQIYVYEDNGTLVSVAANTMKEEDDYTDIRLDPAKKYYLQINSTMDWAVVLGTH